MTAVCTSSLAQRLLTNAMIVLGQTAENLSVPLWFVFMEKKIHGNADEYVQFMVMILWYPVFYAFVYLYFYLRYPEYVVQEKAWKLWYAFVIALPNTFNGVFTIVASGDPHRVSPIITGILGNTTIFTVLLCYRFFLRQPLKMNIQKWAALAVVAVSFVLSILPSFLQVWCPLFLPPWVTQWEVPS